MRLVVVRLLLAGLWLPSVSAAVPGLVVRSDGELFRDGVPFRGVGVNYYDAFVRTLADPPRLDPDAGFRELAGRRIPFARFSAGGYWPVEWGLYQTNRSEHFARLDRVVESARRHGVALIPSLFWNLATVPDLVGEPVSRWGDIDSATHRFMREYTRDLVRRYAASPAILAWEFGNEFNLAADLPNAASHRPPVVPRLGTPASRAPDDDLTHDMIRIAFRAFASEVRQHDPHRAIITGNAFPRLSAWHQAHEKTWTPDTPDQFAFMLTADNPSPVNTLSVRAYDLTNDLARVERAMRVSRSVKKPLFIGEFGVPGPPTPVARDQFAAVLRSLQTNDVPLAALWVFDFEAQANEWNVTATNARSWQLDAIQEANDDLRRRTASPPGRAK